MEQTVRVFHKKQELNTKTINCMVPRKRRFDAMSVERTEKSRKVI